MVGCWLVGKCCEGVMWVISCWESVGVDGGEEGPKTIQKGSGW